MGVGRKLDMNCEDLRPPWAGMRRGAQVEEKCVKNNTRKNNYLFIDEVQLCNSFEKALNSLHATEKYDIYVTGSNAFLLSSDLATLFTGRTFEIQVFPFSFAEYVKYYKPKNPEASFDAYLKEGGMAGAFLYKTENEKFRYVNEDVFSTLVIRDIVKKYKIRNKVFLEKLIDFEATTSSRNIPKHMRWELKKVKARFLKKKIKHRWAFGNKIYEISPSYRGGETTHNIGKLGFNERFIDGPC